MTATLHSLSFLAAHGESQPCSKNKLSVNSTKFLSNGDIWIGCKPRKDGKSVAQREPLRKLCQKKNRSHTSREKLTSHEKVKIYYFYLWSMTTLMLIQDPWTALTCLRTVARAGCLQSVRGPSHSATLLPSLPSSSIWNLMLKTILLPNRS